MIWSTIASLIGGPVVNGLINAYKAKLEAGNSSERIAADLAARELAVQQREAELRIDQIRIDDGRWWTSAPRAVVMWSLAIFVAKCMVWDKVLGWGSTDPLGGDIQQWAGLVMAMWFGGRSIEKVARILRR
ncbi:hypothetical protein, partial [Rhodoplanes roseus]|uniref:hypothetical protein n=1 Tax=Rhodoplanes roseus TaxID=29409 RepID=UPI000DACB334